MSFCSECGAPLNGASVCPRCGYAAEPAQAQAQPSAQPAYQQAQYQPQPMAYSPPPSYAPPKQPSSGGLTFFCEKVVGLIPIGLLLIATIVIMIISIILQPHFATNFGKLFPSTWLPTVGLMVGAALTVRAWGLDFSLPYVAMIGGLVYASTHSILLAMLVCLMIGAINGGLLWLLKLPSYTMIAIAVILAAIGMFANGGSPIKLEMAEAATNTALTVSIITMVILIVGAFLYVVFTPLGKPRAARKPDRTTQLTQFLAYALAALLAGVGGVILVVRMGTFTSAAFGYTDLSLMILVWAALNSSKWFDNRFVPILLALLVHTMIRITMLCLIYIGAGSAVYYLVNGIFVLLFVAAAGIAGLPAKKGKA